MADRAGGEGKPGVPKEVFELDKDERWQARLDEARARREIALREKAAGKPQKPRPKPWEVEGATIDKPPEINPVIQERGDDKFDFADRLETIRDTKDEPDSQTAAVTPEPPAPQPRSVAPAAPEARARPQPSLVLPGAPDVAELAARYAATLDTPETLTTRTPTRPVMDEIEPEPTAELVALPTAAPAPQPAPEARPLTRAERRRGIRPLGMAITLFAFAALPLSMEAPPLETGPEMPLVDMFRSQPALGVTWSIYEAPFQTSADAWRPAGAPPRLTDLTAPFSASTALQGWIVPLRPPTAPTEGALNWLPLAPVLSGTPNGLAPPAAEAGVPPTVEAAPEPLAPSVVVAPVETPTVAIPEETAPVAPRETVAPNPAEPLPPLPESAVTAPPRPATLIENEIQPPAPTTPPAPRPGPSNTVVEADPLRVTILAPQRVSRALTDDIATNLQRDGHELVRVKDVDFNISNRNVRYFHAQDRDSAARMAARYDAELRDFTWFRPKPLEGTAELWLAGRSPSGNTSGRSQGTASPARAENRTDVLEQVFDRLGLGTELPAVVPRARDIRNILPGGSGSQGGN